MRARVMVTCSALLGLAFIGVLRIPGMSDLAVLLISDGGQLAAAMLGTLGCALAARRTAGHRRRSWAWLAAGTGSWAAGQTVWSYYEVVLGREVPFPSAADVGFLLFPLAAAVGLVMWLGTQSDQLVARGRDILDGALIACSLLVLSWVTTLGSVVAEGGDPVPLALSLAYPIGDLILGTLVLIALARGTGAERTTLAILALGLGGLALSDSAYVYLVSAGAYSSADLISSGWVIGFLLVGVAGLTVKPEDTDVAHGARPARDRWLESGAAPQPSLLRLCLPYVPLLVAGTTLCVNLVNAPSTPTLDLLLGVLLVVIVMTRQFLAMTENQRLLAELARAHDQLAHHALHDSLTGLANRVLFSDRLDRALLRPDAHVSLLFCDLDDFKRVNDQRGHEGGDALLREVSRRLLECVRVTDTVARIGGDEFAILLEDARDSHHVADRVVASMREPVHIDGGSVGTSISVGIAHYQGVAAPDPPDERRRPRPRRRARTPSPQTLVAAAEREATALLLLRHADTAMYEAKGAGKGRAVMTDVVLGTNPRDEES
ncbi:MAG: GGDEF domain-containing protein [Marmoricola sp.]